MKKLILVALLVALAVPVMAQDYKAQDDAMWYRATVKDWWMLRQAGYTINTWDSVTTTAVWSEPFRAYDYMSVIVRVIKDSVRGYWEYWSGIDTTRATMVFGRTLEWDKAADLDSAYTSSTGYWNCNITSEAIPIHYYGRLKYVPGASGGRTVNDDSLLTVHITGRR